MAETTTLVTCFHLLDHPAEQNTCILLREKTFLNIKSSAKSEQPRCPCQQKNEERWIVKRWARLS
jgi:hypothetical protein